jgi:hypothetical protein
MRRDFDEVEVDPLLVSPESMPLTDRHESGKLNVLLGCLVFV